MRTVVVTVLVLSGMEVVLSSSAATGRVGSAFTSLAMGLQYLMSPAYPLVPDLRLPASQRPHVPTGNAVSPDYSIPTLPPVEGSI